MNPASIITSASLTPSGLHRANTTATQYQTNTQRREALQEFVDRKDWKAMQTLLTECPDTYRQDGRDVDQRHALELHGLNIRELGDFAEHFPADAWMPALMINWCDLSGIDTRIQGLTAHRYSHGLWMDNSGIGHEALHQLIEGARQCRLAGHVGLRELGFMFTVVPSMDQMLSRSLPEADFNQDWYQLGPILSELDQLIALSPSLRSFAISGMVPVAQSANEGVVSPRFALVMFDNLLGALSRTPLERLQIDNCSRGNFCYTGDVPIGLHEWEHSKTVAVNELFLTRWNLSQSSADPHLAIGEQRLLGADGILRAGQDWLHLTCHDLHQAAEAARVLANVLIERDSPTTVCWTLNGKEADKTWAAFADHLFTSNDDHPARFGALLELQLTCPHREDLHHLTAGLEHFRHLASLVIDDQAADEAALNDFASFTTWEKSTQTLISSLGKQPFLNRLDIEDLFDELSRTRETCVNHVFQQLNHAVIHHLLFGSHQPSRADDSVGGPGRIANPALTQSTSDLQKLQEIRDVVMEYEHGHTDHRKMLNHSYQRLLSSIERGVRQDRIARHMSEAGLDLGYHHVLDRDVSTVLVGHLRPSWKRGELGHAVLPIALTNKTNYTAWALAARKV